MLDPACIVNLHGIYQQLGNRYNRTLVIHIWIVHNAFSSRGCQIKDKLLSFFLCFYFHIQLELISGSSQLIRKGTPLETKAAAKWRTLVVPQSHFLCLYMPLAKSQSFNLCCGAGEEPHPVKYPGSLVIICKLMG